MTNSDKVQAAHAWTVLNHLSTDVLIAVRMRGHMLTEVHPKPPLAVAVGINRVCLSALFLALCKWDEFYREYHGVVPDDCRVAAKDLVKTLKKKRIVAFRNKFVGHILDKDKKRPLTPDEVDAAVDHIVGGDQEAFLRWCNESDPAKNTFPDTVVAIIEHTRNRIRDEYGLVEGDILNPPTN